MRRSSRLEQVLQAQEEKKRQDEAEAQRKQEELAKRKAEKQAEREAKKQMKQKSIRHRSHSSHGSARQSDDENKHALWDMRDEYDCLFDSEPADVASDEMMHGMPMGGCSILHQAPDDVRNMWQLASVMQFLYLSREVIGIPPITTHSLLADLQTCGMPDSKGPLRVIIASLLKGMGIRKSGATLSPETVPEFLAVLYRKIGKSCLYSSQFELKNDTLPAKLESDDGNVAIMNASEGNVENTFEDGHLNTSSTAHSDSEHAENGIAVKEEQQDSSSQSQCGFDLDLMTQRQRLLLLYQLCCLKLDTSDKLVQDLDECNASALRYLPFGFDGEGSALYYIEDPEVDPSGNCYVFKECKPRATQRNVHAQSQKVKSIKRKGNYCKSSRNNRNHVHLTVVEGNWSILCANKKEVEELTARFENSGDKEEQESAQAMRENILDTIDQRERAFFAQQRRLQRIAAELGNGAGEETLSGKRQRRTVNYAEKEMEFDSIINDAMKYANRRRDHKKACGDEESTTQNESTGRPVRSAAKAALGRVQAISAWDRHGDKVLRKADLESSEESSCSSEEYDEDDDSYKSEDSSPSRPSKRNSNRQSNTNTFENNESSDGGSGSEKSDQSETNAKMSSISAKPKFHVLDNLPQRDSSHFPPQLNTLPRMRDICPHPMPLQAPVSSQTDRLKMFGSEVNGFGQQGRPASSHYSCNQATSNAISPLRTSETQYSHGSPSSSGFELPLQAYQGFGQNQYSQFQHPSMAASNSGKQGFGQLRMQPTQSSDTARSHSNNMSAPQHPLQASNRYFPSRQANLPVHNVANVGHTHSNALSSPVGRGTWSPNGHRPMLGESQRGAAAPASSPARLLPLPGLHRD